MRKLHPFSWLLALVLALSLSSCRQSPSPTLPVPEGTLEIHYIDVGQADSALLRCGTETLLIDGGNVADSSLLVSYLDRLGVERLDTVVCTHAHEDHVGGLSGPLSQLPAGQILSPVDDYSSRAFGNFSKYAQAQGLSLLRPAPGDTFAVGTALVTVLGPVKNYDEPNDTSIVLRVDFGDTAFLFTGDMERTAEEDLLNSGADLSVDVLKVGHHGSSTSTSYPFLRAVAPEVAVISVGADNDYGHPHEEVMSRLRDAETTVYRTDLQGTVIAVSDGASISFTTEKGAGADTNPNPEPSVGIYIGNANSKVYHRPECTGLPAPQNQVSLPSRQEAETAGYTPCSRCKP